MARILSILFLLLLSCVPIAKGKVTRHFHPAKLSISLPYQEAWEANASIPHLLNQPFRFLANGSQSYVFESTDGTTVLKFFRYNRSKFRWIHELKSRLHGRRKADVWSKIDKTFRAYALALREVPEGTGLLYVHLNPTKGMLPQVEVEDPIGRKWKLALDRYCFVVQRKAEPLMGVLSQALEDEKAMERLIDSFVEVLRQRVKRGIRNSDHNLGPNFGVIEGRVVEIDCGNFLQDPELLDPERQKEEIRRFTRQLGGWLGVRVPKYENYLLSRLDIDFNRL